MERTSVFQKEEVKDDEENDVKSRAVVVYSAVACPVQYSQLKCNTDIKQPPSNWLTSSTKSYGLHHGLFKNNGFTSFHLAHLFPNCLGEVDVVSDAENIKKLLKIPYNKAPVSMMVHRIENTLLIDEFDIQKHLILRAESDWKWLRKFFFDNIINSLSNGKLAGLGQGWSSRSLLQQRSLLSKFLHYSFAKRPDESSEEHSQVPPPRRWPCPAPAPPPSPPALKVEGAVVGGGNSAVLPDPDLGEALPPGNTSQYTFIRNVAWTFEDIRMLLGTDMPIFGGGTHPCISLRLRDIKKPISVLTGLDYWLDNLMSNVPEVVMCYHLDGIVKRYELIKTEDLPHLPGSKFSPRLIRDVAQNILSFLKTNATKAGHTYWLFKARNDDVVKLYDLSSLCSESLMNEENPFTVPVGLLMYRLARNMKQTAGKSVASENEVQPLQPGTVRMLLENSISLLPKDKYPQIVMSAEYMLADLYLPADTDPSCPQLVDEDQSETPFDASSLDDYSASAEVAIEYLCSGWDGPPPQPQKPPPPLIGTVIERCSHALEHVSRGLSCMPFFTALSCHQNDEKEEESEPRMAQPSEPIPMPYASLDKEKQKNGSNNGQVVKVEEGNRGDNKTVSLPWRSYLYTLLLEKAQLASATLQNQYYSNEKYGLSLACAKRYAHITNAVEGRKDELSSQVLKQLGDTYLAITKTPNSSSLLLEVPCDSFLPALDYVDRCQPAQEWLDVFLDFSSEMPSSKELLVTSKLCYSTALKLTPADSCLLKRLANSHNEISTTLLNEGCGVMSCIGDEEDDTCQEELERKARSLFEAAENELKEGMKLFEELGDVSNLALLYSNAGRVLRVCAHYLGQSPRYSDQKFHVKAEEYYVKGLKTLGNRKEHSQLWDIINWELCSAMFNLASHWQKSEIPLNRTVEEVSKDVVDLYNKALKYCDVHSATPHLIPYQYRAAKIHQQLASLFHKQCRKGVEESKRRYVVKLAQGHFAKAADLLVALECPVDSLHVLAERLYLQQSISEGRGKTRQLEICLSLFAAQRPAFSELASSSQGGDEHENSEEKGEIEKLLAALYSILCDIFKNIVKLGSGKSKPHDDEGAYKKAYSTLLKGSASGLKAGVFVETIDCLPARLHSSQPLYSPSSK